jgi:hypothetical protein
VVAKLDSSPAYLAVFVVLAVASGMVSCAKYTVAPRDGGTADGTDTPLPDAAGPRVVSVDPADQSPNVEPTAKITITFSEPLDPTTVASSTVTLVDGLTAVAGAITYTGVTATLIPTDRLSLDTTYQLKVSKSVTSAGGSPLAADFTSSFTVRAGAWGAEVMLPGGGVSPPVVGIDARGDALAVWSQSSFFVASWHPVQGNWSPPVAISALSGSYPQVAVNSKGDAVVTWSEVGDASMARQYRDGKWENAPQRIDEGTPLLPIAATMSDAGEAIMTSYSLSASSAFLIYARHSSAVGAWGPLTKVGEAYNSTYVALGSEPGGNAFLIWGGATSDGGPKSIFVTRLVPSSTTWLAASAIPSTTVTGTQPTYIDPIIAPDPDGGAMAIWKTTDENLWGARFTKVGGWTSPVSIDHPTNADRSISAQRIAFDGTSFRLIWKQSVAGIYNIYANTYSADSWGLTRLISSGDYSTGGAILSTNQRGRSATVWEQANSTDTGLDFSRISISTESWSLPVEINSQKWPIQGTLGIGEVDFRLSANGMAVAAWPIRDVNLRGGITIVYGAIFQ